MTGRSKEENDRIRREMTDSVRLGKDVVLAEGSCVYGDVELGDETNVWYNAVIRGDENSIRIGRGVNVQDCAVIHTNAHFTVTIGDYVSVGHGAIVHGCSVGDNTTVGMGSILMNGAVIGKNCMIAAGCVVTQGMKVEDGSLVVGVPGKVIRKLRPEEIEEIITNSKDYILLARRIVQ